MATFKSFVEIESWKSSRELCKMIFSQINSPVFSKDFALKDQINRASGSIMDNIAEGSGRGGNKEFVLFLGYSNGSCSEVQSQLIRAMDRNYISKDNFNLMFKLTNNISKMNGSLIDYEDTPPIREMRLKLLFWNLFLDNKFLGRYSRPR